MHPGQMPNRGCRLRFFRKPLRIAAVACLLAGGGLLAQPERLTDTAPVYVLTYKGVIGPATVELMKKALREAQQGGGQLLIVELDTPGGLDASTREITQLLVGSPIPVAVYVAPGGARAASAGTYILYAAHIAAMAEATSIGAATPVLLTEEPRIPLPRERPDTDKTDKADKDDNAERAEGDDEAGDQGESVAEDLLQPLTAMERKARNDAVAHIRGLAELRGRNADWAEAAVRQAVSVSATEALEKGAIEYIAPSRADLLRALDGVEIQLQRGAVTLQTAAAQQIEVQPGLQIELLTWLASPALASALLAFGTSLIFLEFYVGALGFAAGIGIGCVAIGAYGLNLLPLEYSGMALMFAGAGFVIADLILGVTGFLLAIGAALLLAGGFLFSRIEGDYWALSSPPLWGLLLLLASVGGILVWVILAHRKPTVSGQDSVRGETVEVVDDFENEGWVFFRSERWKGRIDGKVRRGEELYITDIEGLTLLLSRESPTES